MLARIAASPSKTLLTMAFAFVAGIAAHAFDERAWAAPIGLILMAFVAIALIASSTGAARTRFVFVAMTMFAAGLGRYDFVAVTTINYAEPPSKESRYVGTVVGIPDQTIQGAVLRMDRVFVSDTRIVIGAADIRFRIPVLAAPGDVLEWSCRVRVRMQDGSRWCAPREPPTTVSRLPQWHPSRALAWFKVRVRSTIGQLLPEPDASVVLGLLIGDKGGMPREVVDGFRRTGTSHLLAVSGSNVQQVIEAAFVLFATMSVRRKRAAFGVVALLAGFVVITGAEASVVRAAIMGGFGLAAGMLGRRSLGLVPLMVAAAAMLWFDPTLLRNDVGFRLSFAAVAGLRSYGSVFSRLFGKPDELGFKKALGETLAASVTTIPISLLDFGTLPIGSPVANLAVVPLVPSIMASGAASLAFGSVWVPLAAPFAFVTGSFCRALTGMIMTFSRVSPVLEFEVTFWQVAVMYLSLIMIRCVIGNNQNPS